MVGVDVVVAIVNSETTNVVIKDVNGGRWISEITIQLLGSLTWHLTPSSVSRGDRPKAPAL